MTNEEMLKAVIEAQVKGGCDRFATILTSKKKLIFIKDLVAFADHSQYNHVLGLLLDASGLRAAYGTKPDCPMPPRGNSLQPRWVSVAQSILFVWLAKPEGDAEGAIRTAFQLLPKDSTLTDASPDSTIEV